MSVGENVSLKDSKVVNCFGFFPDSVDDVCQSHRGVVWVNVNGVNSLHN